MMDFYREIFYAEPLSGVFRGLRVGKYLSVGLVLGDQPGFGDLDTDLDWGWVGPSARGLWAGPRFGLDYGTGRTI